jgi:hypothetical protein
LLKDTIVAVNKEDLPEDYTLIYTTSQLKVKRKAIDGTPEK